ncbi:PREDICTED: fibrinogen-like protein 1 [Drosophila arizonae]|uniref:Fibrinogen-like protein 1 n=1 Tax=Drosophila arizonae TaxID=7263 RepID=A0ABM1NPI3_DROAR|nr:PREDICTED: fibrinogen-like protein 1 [Drosophila arizonae]
MTMKLYTLLLVIVLNIIATQANLLEILRIQDQLKNSFHEIERLQAKYKSKIEEAILMEKQSTLQDLRMKISDELTSCREEKSALEMLNKIYSEQITELQKKANDVTALQLEEKDRQINEGLATMATFRTIINEQAKQIHILTDDTAVKSQTILNMETKPKEIAERLKNNLEELKTKTKHEIEASSCAAFPDSNGVHLIKVDQEDAFPVACDSSLAGPGWTVVQRRIDGSVEFNRNWLEYREGFGNLSGEFFIGLEKLHRLTASQPHELYVYLTDFNNESSYAYYDKIVVAGESEAYALSELGEYSGNAGDSMRDNEHQKFSTFDRDNDQFEFNCADACLGGWWFNNCGLSNLNGRYTIRELYYDRSEYGIFWDSWQGPGLTLQSVQIMIRPKIFKERQNHSELNYF